MDSYTEVSSEGCLSRLMGSFVSVLIGIALIIGSGVLMFWNEGRAVKTARGLAEGGSAVVDVAADKVDAANDNRLVHVSGEATTKDTVKDAEYGVQAQGLVLSRGVEMYQWKQEEKSQTRTKIGGGTETVKTYTYTKEWSSGLHKSSEFKQPQGHQNPASMPSSEKFVAPQVTLGAFTLPAEMVRRIDAFQPVTPNADEVAQSPVGASMRVVNGQLYKGTDPAAPTVGDLRVIFRVVPPTVISVIAQQSGSSFQPFATKSGDPISMLVLGNVGSAQMFKEAEESNARLTWILRGVGWLLMSVGIGMLFSPLTTMASVLPFLGDLLGFGIFLFALVIGAAISLFIVAAGWIVYRPLLGVGLLVGGLALIFFLKQAAGGRK